MPDTDLDEVFAAVSSEYESADNGSADFEDDAGDYDDVQVDEPDVLESTDDVDDLGDYEETDNFDDGAGDVSWNWEEYADRQVPFKVAGEDGVVTLRELRDGYMRNQDYTRKTQEVAEVRKAAQWAQDVQTAFERDPMGTLEAFANAYGLLDQQAGAGQQDKRFSLDELDEDIRPWAEQAMQAQQAAAQLERRLADLETERIKAEVRAEVDSLRNQFGESFDAVETLKVAAAKNMSLIDAHWYLSGQRNVQMQKQNDQAGRAAAEAAARQREADEAKRAQRKRTASASSKGSFRASDIPVDDFNDIGELFEQIAASSGG